MDVFTECKITNYNTREWNESNTALEKGQTVMNLEWRTNKGERAVWGGCRNSQDKNLAWGTPKEKKNLGNSCGEQE